MYLLIACWRLVLRMCQGRASSPKETVLLGEGGWTTGFTGDGAGEAPRCVWRGGKLCVHLRRGGPGPLGNGVAVESCSLTSVTQKEGGVKTPVPK